MTTQLLKIEHLAIELGSADARHLVVADVSLDVGPGEVVGLVGESGSGKSLSARAAIGLLPHGVSATGSVQVVGTEVSKAGPRELRKLRTSDVAMIFQDPRAHINPVRRVGDFMTEALRYQGMGRADAESEASSLLEKVRIHEPTEILRRYPHQLSGGMLQRVMIASALATSPKLLLADEPTTALDVSTQAEVVAILEELRRERGMGMLFITHDLQLAEAIADRTVVMYAGRTVEAQSAAVLHQRPSHPYTAGLLRSRPQLSAEVPDRLPVLPGRPLAAYQVPDGCAFADRCPFVEDACRASEQELRPVDGGGLVACRRADELALGESEVERA